MRKIKSYSYISITFEYNQENGEIGFTVGFGGPKTDPLDPLSDDTNIAFKLLKASAPDVAYRYADGKNIVEGHIL
jgi:hypothetical protein